MTETQIIDVFANSFKRTLGYPALDGPSTEIQDVLAETKTIHVDFRLNVDEDSIVYKKIANNVCVVTYRPLPQTWKMQMLNATGWAIEGKLTFDEKTEMADIAITAKDRIPVTY